MADYITTSLIEAIKEDSDSIFCLNMKAVAERIIDKYPEERHLELHHRFASICFYLKLTNESFQSLEKINQQIHFEEGYDQERFYRTLVGYISSMDSILDILEKASIKLELNSVKRFDRSILKYNFILNTIRNFLMHEGIPFCRVDRHNRHSNIIRCADIADTVERNVSFSLEVIFNSKKLTRDNFSLDYLISIYPQFKSDVENYLADLLTDKKLA